MRRRPAVLALGLSQISAIRSPDALQPSTVPQVHKQRITVGNRYVGSLWVDGGAIHGQGAALHPELVIPLTIDMANRPAESMVAIVWVRGRLCTEQHAFPQSAVAAPASELLIEGFPARSLPNGSNEHTMALRFRLTLAELEALEQHRHPSSTDPFTLYLGVDAVVAGLRAHNQLQPGREQEQTPWEYGLGMFSELLPFWHTQIQPLSIAIEHSTWVREVLPGLGYERSRMIEISFPPPLPDHSSAASEWDKARRALDERRYADCVAECRDLLSMWQRQLGATRERPVATVIAGRHRWPERDGRRRFLDGVWKAVVDLVNVPHHPEGQTATQDFGASDARLVLLLTAALSAYINE